MRRCEEGRLGFESREEEEGSERRGAEEDPGEEEVEEEDVKRVAGVERRYVSAARRNAQPSAEGGGEDGGEALDAAEEFEPDMSNESGRMDPALAPSEGEDGRDDGGEEVGDMSMDDGRKDSS